MYFHTRQIILTEGSECRTSSGIQFMITGPSEYGTKFNLVIRSLPEQRTQKFWLSDVYSICVSKICILYEMDLCCPTD